MKKNKPLDKYLEDFERDRQANDDIRDKCNEEMRFCLIAGGQWEDWEIKGYDNRPRMEVDQTSPYLYRTYAKYCDNRLQVDFQPDDDATSDDVANVMDGLYRRDVHRRGGMDCIDTAVFEQMTCGFGAVLIGEDYDNPEDPDDNHQNIEFVEIPNAYSSVFFDSSSVKADKSDARHVTYLKLYSKERFKELWPNFDPSGLTTNDRKFFNFNAGTDMCYVATRYETKTKSEVFYFYFNPVANDTVRVSEKSREKDEPELLRRGYQFTRRRTLRKQSVYKVMFTGQNIIEPEKRIAGKHLPIAAIFGFRGFIDGQEYFHGLARKKMDIQRMLNMVGSLTAESAARSHPEIPIFTNDQMASDESHNLWTMDKSRLSYLTVDPHVDENGNLIAAGQVGSLKGEAMTQSGAMLVQMTNDLLRQQVGGAPQDVSDPNASGKAINSLLAMTDQDTRVVFDNISKFTKRIGQIYLSKAKEIYGGSDNKNRLVRIVTDKDKTKPVKLMSQGATDTGLGVLNDLSKGKFEVVVDVGKSYQSRQEETFENLKDILVAVPPQSAMFNTLLSQLIQSMPNSGMDDIKDFLRKQMLLEGSAKPESEEEQQFLQQATENQPPDVNSEYLASETEKNMATVSKTLTAARLDEARVQETIAKAKKTKIEAAVKAAEMGRNLPN